jgi:predicted nucleic acid-binding Zn ribbon protein
MTDDPVVSCATCSRPVQRVFHPVAIHFKGKGFYNTDYGTRRRNRESAAAAESGADSHAAKSKDKASEKSSGKSDAASTPKSDGSGTKTTD